MEWQDVMVAAGVILAAFGGIKIISDGIHAIQGWLPVANLTKRCDDLETRVDDIDKQMERLERVMTKQSLLMVEVANHLLTGNDKDALKKKMQELQEALIE